MEVCIPRRKGVIALVCEVAWAGWEAGRVPGVSFVRQQRIAEQTPSMGGVSAVAGGSRPGRAMWRVGRQGCVWSVLDCPWVSLSLPLRLPSVIYM